MLLDEGMDTGPVLAQSPPIVLTGKERAGELQGRLFEEGASMLPAVLDGLEDVTIVATPQDDSKATVTRLIARSDGEIDWSLPAEQIDRMIRAYDPWPGTFTSWNDKGLKILDVNLSGRIDAVDDSGRVIVNGGKLFVGTGSGPLEITRLQLEGRQGVSASDFLRGRPDIDDAVLGVLS